uniref:Uncharacterized protein n=1 Tax=Aegilops tauschii subsp. strangulata TaxID=200361 RepID=A0A453E4K2_AEGTS
MDFDTFRIIQMWKRSLKASFQMQYMAQALDNFICKCAKHLSFIFTNGSGSLLKHNTV